MNTLFFFHLVESVFESLPINIHNNATEHGDQPSVSIMDKSIVSCFIYKGIDCRFIQAEVQNSIHHARHRKFCTRSHRYEKGINRITELHPHRFFNLFQVRKNLIPHSSRIFLTGFEVFIACFGSHRKASRDRDFQVGHFCKSSTFAPEQVLH